MEAGDCTRDTIVTSLCHVNGGFRVWGDCLGREHGGEDLDGELNVSEIATMSYIVGICMYMRIVMSGRLWNISEVGLRLDRDFTRGRAMKLTR